MQCVKCELFLADTALSAVRRLVWVSTPQSAVADGPRVGFCSEHFVWRWWLKIQQHEFCAEMYNV